MNRRFTLYIKPTERCNLNCLHCYNKFGDNQSILDLTKFSRFMESFANYWKGREEVQLDIVLHGGEPTMVGLSYLEELVRIVKSQLIFLPSEQLKFSVQTNLVTVPINELIAFVRRHCDGMIGTSYSPGIRFVGQDRKYEDLWVKNLQICDVQSVSSYVVVSLSKEFVERGSILDLIDLFARSKVVGFHFEPITPNGNAQEHWEQIAPTPEQHDEWKAKFAETMIRTRVYSAFPECEIVRKAKSFFDGRYVGCACRDCMVTVGTVNADGTLGICPNTSKSQVFGDISEPFEHFMSSHKRTSMIVKERSRRAECYDCEYFQVCNGSCMQTSACYEGKKFYGMLKQMLKTNQPFYEYVRDYARNSRYCSESAAQYV